MIRNYITGDKGYSLIPPGISQGSNGANQFTVIVGKNGTGKSRLLQGIVTELLRSRTDQPMLSRQERSMRLDKETRSVDRTQDPSRIICLSTSPFDRFPLLRRGTIDPVYSYLGLRGLPSQNLSVSYISRIIATLIQSSVLDRGNSHVISEVLHYLGYKGVIQCTFEPSIRSRLQEELRSARSEEEISSIIFKTMPVGDVALPLRQLRDSSFDQVKLGLDILEQLNFAGKITRINVSLDTSGVHAFIDDSRTSNFRSGFSIETSDLLVLVTTGLLRLREVTLEKFGSEPFRMSEASSGEQTVIMGILGIGSQIQDNSLICIDEPEVCLHPEWQERYVHLLLNAFQDSRGCHFLIATHSPQVVAELPESNCFVMAMETGTAIESRSVSHKSIDFQLASVFTTPGHRNEYLNRIALNLFYRVSKNKKFDAQDEENMSLLNKLFNNINESDPLRELISTLHQMQLVYGRDR